MGKFFFDEDNIEVILIEQELWKKNLFQHSFNYFPTFFVFLELLEKVFLYGVQGLIIEYL